jgi:hypothetical protein
MVKVIEPHPLVGARDHRLRDGTAEATSCAAHPASAAALAVGVWVLAVLIVLGRAGFQLSPLPFALARWGTWILVGVLSLGALMNLASPSSWERFLWGPVALILAVLCLVLARGTTPAPRPGIDRRDRPGRAQLGR